MFRIFSFALMLTLALPTMTHAHFLWVLVRFEGDKGTIDVVFEEAPRAGDGQYLDPIVKKGTTWVRTIDEPKPRELDLKEMKENGKRWLSGALPVKEPYAIESYVKWGVYRYGQTDALLYYYAKHVDGGTQKQTEVISRSEKLDLDIAPTFANDKVNVQVFWKGKPVSNAKVYVRGPKGLKHDLITNRGGRASFNTTQAGLYTVRTSFIEADKSGEYEEKAYTQVRHTATLTMRLPLKE